MNNFKKQNIERERDNMSFKIKYETRQEAIERLNEKKRLAELKYQERKIKMDILKLYFPFLNFKFNKFIVLLCVTSIVLYTIAAILLQRNTSLELSPTLTTCVFAFFGTELIGLAGIRICDSKKNTEDYYE